MIRRPPRSTLFPLHDALPIWTNNPKLAAPEWSEIFSGKHLPRTILLAPNGDACRDRKSTRLNSSHDQISYAVFCLKKKKTTESTNFRLLDSERSPVRLHAR